MLAGPFALAPFAQGVEVNKNLISLTKSDLLNKVMTRKQ